MKHLSLNSKGLTTFDLSRQDSKCQENCNVSNVCYINNNLQDKMNKKYKDKMRRNYRLINSDKFVSKISKEIRYNNKHRVRFMSNGDLSSNQKTGLKQIDNICKLARVNPFNRFWITTRNFNVIYEYFNKHKHKKPDNCNFMLSVDKTLNEFIKSFCLSHKIQLSMITDKHNKANCKSSKNGKSCIDNNCDDCFYYSTKTRYWKIHGKGNKEKWTQ